MDKEKVQYIINYFSHLLTPAERMAIKHTNSMYKLENGFDSPNAKKRFLEIDWISENQNVLELLKYGYDHFESIVAQRILDEKPERVYFNTCPQCQKLTRTPYSRQCRFCAYNWHHQIVAKFKLNTSFKVTGRSVFLCGDTIDGEISKNLFIDLTLLGIYRKLKIASIEFVRRSTEEKNIEEIAIGINGLTEDEERQIINFGRSFIPIDIFKNE
jgi:hypothetical protein